KAGRMLWEPGAQKIDYDAIALADPRDTPQQMDAFEFIQSLLNDPREQWPLRAKETLQKGVAIGISTSALARARRALGITAKKCGARERAEWRWHKPRRGHGSDGRKPDARLPL